RGIVVEFAPERGVIVIDEAVRDLAGPPVDRPPRARAPHRWSRHGKGAADEGDGRPEDPAEGDGG
ncbi:MAG TPA: hypothetical protein VET90_05800, partial [Candidatus Binatus sp.]|nr:hypothetical protein [Candidatus Binatus sp.]